jgi:hypothetical protein
MYYWWAVLETSRQYSPSLDLPHKNREFFKLALELIKNSPGAYLRNSVGELAYVWAGYLPHPGKSRPLILPGASALEKNWGFLVFGLILGTALFTLVVLASVLAVLERRWLAVGYILPALSIPMLMALISVTGYRYRLVVEPLILTLAGYALLRIQAWFQQKGFFLSAVEA